MKTCKNRTAEERYRVSRNIMVLVLVCVAVFAGIIIYDLITGSPISSYSSTFLVSSASSLVLNAVNMRRAKEAMTAEAENKEEIGEQ